MAVMHVRSSHSHNSIRPLPAAAEAAAVLVATAVVVVGALFSQLPPCHAADHEQNEQLRQFPLSSKVNLLVGTGGEGFGVGSDPPGVQVPFGALRLSPDTSLDNVVLEPNHFGGYHHADNEIRCFSHTHMVGPGVLDFGNIAVMATRTINPSVVNKYGYRSKFTHDNELAMPGYYQVYLDDPEVRVELTACASHAGIHRYTSNSSTAADPIVLLLDPTHSLTPDACNGSFVQYNASSEELSGWMINQGSLTRRNGRGVKVFFAAKVVASVADFGTWNSSGIFNGSTSSSAAGTSANGIFIVSKDSSVEVRVAISFISMTQARANLDQQLGNQTFEACCLKTRRTWEDNLSKVKITARDDDTEIKFYTALYHSFMAPTNYAEVGGVYVGMDGEVHALTPGQDAAYSDMSIWDIHRTQASLLAWLQPSIAKDVYTSLVNMMLDGGDLPRWPIANVYAGCMIGNHAYQILLDGLVKNCSNFDPSKVYDVMKLEATTHRAHNGRDDLANYLAHGYCLGGHKNSSVSKTLAYAYDDWAVSEFAELLGQHSDAKVFRNRSKNYKNLWDNSRKLMCGRDENGKFHCPADPEFNDWILHSTDFTEGNAAQWKWFAPHDIAGLISLFGSSAEFSKALDEFMEASHRHPLNLLPNPYYWAGNEPDILAPHLFNFAGRSDLTQKHVRWLVDNKYTTRADGLPGNDDYGTLSAWCVWSMLGFYPLTGSTRYIVGSPSVSTATIQLTDTAHITILAHNNTKENIYVTNATVNGRPLEKGSEFLLHSDITMNNATIEFWMSARPPKLPSSDLQDKE